MYQRFQTLLADADLTERRRRVFAFRWADLHEGAGTDSPWHPVLRGRRPDYGGGKDRPAVFLELKHEHSYVRFKSTLRLSRLLMTFELAHLPCLPINLNSREAPYLRSLSVSFPQRN